MANNLPGFQAELSAVDAIELAAKTSSIVAARTSFIRCVAEFRQFSEPLNFPAAIYERRARIAEIAGLTAYSYLNDLGGLLGHW